MLPACIPSDLSDLVPASGQVDTLPHPDFQEFEASIACVPVSSLKRIGLHPLVGIKFVYRDSRRFILDMLYTSYHTALRATTNVSYFAEVHAAMTRRLGSKQDALLLNPNYQKNEQIQKRSAIFKDTKLNAIKCTMNDAEFVTADSVPWPEPLNFQRDSGCAKAYWDATNFSLNAACAVCGCVASPSASHSPSSVLIDIKPEFRDQLLPHLDRLSAHDTYFSVQGITAPRVNNLLHSQLIYNDSSLNNLILDPAGFTYSVQDGQQATLHVCKLCYSSFSAQGPPKIPRLALANHLFRGQLPPQFLDLTWVEEVVCAQSRAVCHIVRVYETGSSDKSAWKLKGNICAVPQNLSSLARVLPNTPSSLTDMISISFVGTRAPDKVALSKFLYIRKAKVWDFLCWLKENNPLYAGISLSAENMQLYPENGLPDELFHVMTQDIRADAAELRATETAGLAEHPADLLDDGNEDEDDFFIEQTGLSDVEQVHLFVPLFFSQCKLTLTESRSSTNSTFSIVMAIRLLYTLPRTFFVLAYI